METCRLAAWWTLDGPEANVPLYLRVSEVLSEPAVISIRPLTWIHPLIHPPGSDGHAVIKNNNTDQAMKRRRTDHLVTPVPTELDTIWDGVELHLMSHEPTPLDGGLVCGREEPWIRELDGPLEGLQMRDLAGQATKLPRSGPGHSQERAGCACVDSGPLASSRTIFRGLRENKK